MDRDLFLAILSMDSYNRGYAPGVDGLPETGQLGNATLLPATAAQKEGWEDAGFYAIAYDLTGAGITGLTGTVISYRGSDYADTGGEIPWSNDVWEGWTNAIAPVGSQPAHL